MTSITVAVRVRPFNSREQKYQSSLIVNMNDSGTTSLLPVRGGKISTTEPPRKFQFDHSFWTHDKSSGEYTINTTGDGLVSPPGRVAQTPAPGADLAPGQLTVAPPFASQEAVYTVLGKGILDNALKGFNACLFAYGQTGSGKTYTMMGAPEDPGVIPRLCADLFARAKADAATTSISVECSYLEIYNELVRDLLNPAGIDTALKVRMHPKLGVFVEGLKKMSVRNADEIAALLEDGFKVRAVAATNMNASSSRSHAIITLAIKVKTADTETLSKLHLVDLAGSERASSTGAEGDTLKEGANINKSLTTLGMCLSRLADAAEGKKGNHIPYRDSQLTWILHESLGGNSRTAMLANISPADINYDETLSTLRFASTTKKIKTNATVNEDPQQRLIRELREEIAKIKDEIRVLLSGEAPIPIAAPATAIEGAVVPSSEGDEAGVTSDDAAESQDVEAKCERLMADLQANITLIGELAETEEEKAERAERDRQEHHALMQKLTAATASGAATSSSSGTPSGSATPSAVATAAAAAAASAPSTSSPRRVTIASSAKPQGGAAVAAAVEDDAPRLMLLNEDLRSTLLPSGQPMEPMYWLRRGARRRGISVAQRAEGDSGAAALSTSETIYTVSAAFTPSPTRWGVPLPPSAEAAQVSAQIAVDTTAHTVTLFAYRSSEPDVAAVQELPLARRQETQVFVNGHPAREGTAVPLQHNDRVFVGPIAFRVVVPAPWRVEADCGTYQREATSVEHLEMLEALGRLQIERELVSALCADAAGGDGDVVETVAAENGVPASWAAAAAALSEWQHTCQFDLAAFETKLVESYPAVDPLAEIRMQDVVAALQFDLHFATQERAEFVAARKRDREALEEQMREREAQLEALRRQVVESQRAEEEARVEQRRQLEVREAEEEAAAVALARERAERDANAKALEVAAMKGSVEARLLLASRVQQYEEELQEAQSWKPQGPSNATESALYRTFLAAGNSIAYSRVRDLFGPTQPPSYQRQIYKMRIKTGFFSRSGFYPVIGAIFGRFLFYFPLDATAQLAVNKAAAMAGAATFVPLANETVSNGNVYLYGATVLPMPDADGKKHVRVVPTVPRKPGILPTDPLHGVELGFETQADLDAFMAALQPLVAPYAAPEVLAAIADH